jgi:hypothetical protein
MSYMSVRIAVIDERNSVANQETTSRYDRHLIEQADVVIRIKPDNVVSNSNLVNVITPSTESVMSMEKAALDKAGREAKRIPDPPPHEALSKAYRALGQSGNFKPPDLPPLS